MIKYFLEDIHGWWVRSLDYPGPGIMTINPIEAWDLTEDYSDNFRYFLKEEGCPLPRLTLKRMEFFPMGKGWGIKMNPGWSTVDEYINMRRIEHNFRTEFERTLLFGHR